LGRAIYARFEQIIALVLIVLIAVVVVVAILDFSKEVLFLAWHGFVNPLDSKMLGRIFGQIMTVLIALEFKRVASPEVTPISTELDGHSPSGAISSNFFGCVCLARMKTPPRGPPLTCEVRRSSHANGLLQVRCRDVCIVLPCFPRKARHTGESSQNHHRETYTVV
jgi:hypothetical protein